MKKMRIKATHIIAVICLGAAIVLLFFLFNNNTKKETVFELKADSAGDNGFSKEALIYTEDGMTNVTFSGNITTDGTAELSILSNDSAEIIYNKTYTAVDSEKVNIEVTGLTPQTYYILRFSSNDAKIGHLLLTTEQALVERPEVPERTNPERK